MNISANDPWPRNFSRNIDHPDDDHQRLVNILLDLFLSVQLIVSLTGLVANSILFYGQARTTDWPFHQRLLFLNVTTASVISTFIHTFQGAYQLYKHSTSGRGTLDGAQKWSDHVGDSAQTAVAVGMVALAFQNLMALRRCDSRLRLSSNGRRNGAKLGTAAIVGLIVAVWATAIGFVSGGLNPQAQVYSEEDTMANNAGSYVAFAIGLLMEMSVASSIYSTRRTLRRLQTDFELRRAQQNLATRLHIKATLRLTSAITRVLLLHWGVWLTSLALGFGMNRFLRGESNLEFRGEEGLAAFTALVDVVALCFDSTYPFLVAWKQPHLGRHMRSMVECRCLNRVTTGGGGIGTAVGASRDVTVIPAIRLGSSQGCPNAHFGAIENMWERVANAKLITPPAVKIPMIAAPRTVQASTVSSRVHSDVER